MIESLLTIYHGINSFLGLPEGVLIKTIIELILFLLVTYMLASEYLRESKREYRLLFYAFVALTFDRLIVTAAYTWIVFLEIPVQTLMQTPVPILDQLLKLTGLVLLGNSFLLMVLPKTKNIPKSIVYQIGFVLLLYPILISIWISQPQLTLKILTTLSILKVLVLTYPIYKLFKGPKAKYKTSVITALLIYLVTPVIDFFNFGFRQGADTYLSVIAHPFPLLAVLLFTRIVYLKLVDKAMLKQKLENTEQKYAHEKEASSLKDEFISIVSHELKTPLTSIKLYLSLLKSGKFGELNKKQTQKLGVIEKESDRLTQLITDVLTLSKLEAKKMRLRTKKIRIYSLLSQTPHNQLAKEQQIEVKYDIPKNLVVKGDESKLTQIHLNLLSNAIKFTPAHGTITITVKKNKDNWVYTIKDTGKGIPEEKVKHLFEKFYQAEHHLTREAGGTGLGLAIVKQLTELHTGKISVKSKIDQGTTFTLKFPNKA